MELIQLTHSHLALTVPLLERKYFSTTVLVLVIYKYGESEAKKMPLWFYLHFKNKFYCVWEYLQLVHKYKFSSIPLILLPYFSNGFRKMGRSHYFPFIKTPSI